LEKIADYITLIDKGRIFYTGTKDGLLEDFCIVKGGSDELTDSLHEKVIGLTVKSTGFTGLLPTSEMKHLSKGIVAETPSIEEILIYISKEGRDHE
jgi:ABC-2 type transport system ATP-binding protein